MTDEVVVDELANLKNENVAIKVENDQLKKDKHALTVQNTRFIAALELCQGNSISVVNALTKLL